MKKGYRRGYPVALLVGIEADRAVIWRIFSNVVKPEKTVHLNGARNDPKALYNFHELTVNALRSSLQEGARSVILVAPARTRYAHEFSSHIASHHAWLAQGSNKVTISEMVGSAATFFDVTELTKKTVLQQAVFDTTTAESANLLDRLEERLNASQGESLVLYSFEEIEFLILGTSKIGKPTPEHLLLADKYLQNSRLKNRLHRLMQIARNKHIKTTVISSDSPTGKRLAQFGGIVCVLKPVDRRG